MKSRKTMSFATSVLLAGSLIWAAVPTEAASVKTPAHLIVSPRPPFVRATWDLSLDSTSKTYTTRAWIVTGSGKVLGFQGIVSTMCCHTTVVSSSPVQVLPHDCMTPAGHAVVDGRIVAETVGPRTCW